MADENNEAKPDMRELAGRYMLAAGIVMGDRIDAGRVQDLMAAFGEQIRGAPRRGETFWVDYIIAVRDKRPYVRLMLEDAPLVQLDMVQARQVAADIQQHAARAEADAMIFRFFDATGLPDGAANAMMIQFRDFRKDLDEGPGAEKRV